MSFNIIVTWFILAKCCNIIFQIGKIMLFKNYGNFFLCGHYVSIV